MDRATSPDQYSEQYRLFPAKGTARFLAVGCGFALAFGWVWSGALRDLLFADVLTGSLFSGQGTSIFFAVLMLVFLLGGIPKFSPAPARMRRAPWLFPLVAHGAALLPLCVVFFFPGPQGIPALAVSLGLAGGLAGLYWGTALLRLPSAAAGLALVTAWLGIPGLVRISIPLAPWLAGNFPMGDFFFPSLTILSGFACLALCAAWLSTARITPDRCPGGEASLPARRAGKNAVAIFLTLTALGMLFSADGYAAPTPLTQCGLEAGGAILALAVFRLWAGRGDGSYRTGFFVSQALSLALPLALLPLAGLRTPVFSWSLHLVTGTLLTVAAMRLAGSSRAEDGMPGLAGRSLAALLAALNAGFHIGTRAAFVREPDNAGLAALLCVCLALLFVLSYFDSRRSVQAPAQIQGQTPPQTPPHPPPGPPGEPSADLTPTEQRVTALLRQGYNNTAISEALGIAQATTRVHLRSIHKKMGTASREELAARLQEEARQ